MNDEGWCERWLDAVVRVVDPDEFTGEFWTGGDGSVVAVVRRLKDGDVYLDMIDTEAVTG